MQTKEQALEKLSRSEFRSRFKLTEKDKEYVREKGIDAIRSHAVEFIRTRLAPAYPKNDGRQTPMRGHPVFVAQHACACCCRGCLEKWYKVPRGVELDDGKINRIADLIIFWISRQIEGDKTNMQ